MNTPWPKSREVEKIKQVSVASLPEDQQEAAMHDTEVASERYPSVPVDGCSLHVFETRGEWEVWLNNEDHDFTGLCVCVGPSRAHAITEARRMLNAVLVVLALNGTQEAG